METPRLLIRALSPADKEPFLRGISDRELCRMYGFPEEMDPEIPPQIFRRFLALPRAYAIAVRAGGNMAGFLLDADPELPEETAACLPGRGRTLAFAVFPACRRRGYMQETLETYIPYLFRTGDADYIHCGHFPKNEASRNLLRKLGFREHARHAAGNRTIVDEILFRE